MKFTRLLLFVIVFILMNSFLFPSKQLADWAYSFVVWDSFIYVVSDEFVEEIDKEIGHVTKYSDMEGTYSGNFSNTYKKGTKYFSIKDISTDEAIAIQEKDGTYKKAIRDGQYQGNKNDITGIDFQTLIVGFMALFLIAAVGIYLVNRRPEK
jgi:hypothetical protein